LLSIPALAHTEVPDNITVDAVKAVPVDELVES
jgi:hypothetical protein